MTALANEERAILDISGSQARQLLHGQCTADVQTLKPGQWTLGALATHQGRLYSSFYCLCLTEEQFWLVLPQRQLENMLGRFSRYAAFFKADLTDVTKQWQMSAPAPDPSVTDQTVTASPDEVTLSIPHGGIRLRWSHTDAATAPPEEGLVALAQAEIAAGIVWITPELNEQYLPQSLAWDLLGGVSFRKGCYTGQEVIARLHYKGATKRRLARVSGAGPAPGLGTRVIDADRDKPAGEVVRAVSVGPGWQGLAVLKWPGADMDLPPLAVNGQPVEVGSPVE